MNGSAQLAIEITKGAWGTVEFALRLSGKCPAREFFDSRLDRKGQARFMNLFLEMAKNGILPPKRFEYFQDKLCGFRHEINKQQIRFPCFLDGKKWVITHGFKKPGAQKGLGKWPPNEVDRAGEIMGEYWERKRSSR